MIDMHMGLNNGVNNELKMGDDGMGDSCGM